MKVRTTATPEDSPIHPLWGIEGPWLLVLLGWGVVVGVAARRAAAPTWVRVVVGATVVFGVGGTLLAGYYPHSTMLGIGVQALGLASWRPADAQHAARS